MRNGSFEAIENVAVDQRAFAQDFELDRFSQFSRRVAHQSRYAADALAEGAQSSAQHSAIEALRGELIGPRDLVEIGNLRGQNRDLALQFAADCRARLRGF